jgi:hypothetical protein
MSDRNQPCTNRLRHLTPPLLGGPQEETILDYRVSVSDAEVLSLAQRNTHPWQLSYHCEWPSVNIFLEIK